MWISKGRERRREDGGRQPAYPPAILRRNDLARWSPLFSWVSCLILKKIIKTKNSQWRKPAIFSLILLILKRLLTTSLLCSSWRIQMKSRHGGKLPSGERGCFNLYNREVVIFIFHFLPELFLPVLLVELLLKYCAFTCDPSLLVIREGSTTLLTKLHFLIWCRSCSLQCFVTF